MVSVDSFVSSFIWKGGKLVEVRRKILLRLGSVPKIILCVFTTLKVNLLPWSHKLRSLRSELIAFVKSVTDLEEKKMLVSSAYIVTSVLCKANGKSLIQIKNRNGPRQGPWGTPYLVSCILGILQFTLQHCFFSFSYAVNQSSSTPSTPYKRSLAARISWSMVSKAFF